MGSIYDAFHLSRLDFPLDDLASLPTYKLALIFAHPLATALHKERAELYFGRARERDRMSGIGSNEERAIKAEQALRREEGGGEKLLLRVKPEPGTEHELPAASDSAVHSTAAVPPAGTPPLERPPAVEESRNNSAPAPLPAFSPPSRSGALASPPLRHVEPRPRQQEAAATTYGARAPSQAFEPRAGPSHSHAGQPLPPIHYPSHPPSHPPPSPDPLPLPPQQAPVPAALLSTLTCLTYTVPLLKASIPLLRLFLLRPARTYGPMPVFISPPFPLARPETEGVYFYVGYRTAEDSVQAQRANEGKGLPSVLASGSVNLSVANAGPAAAVEGLAAHLRWEHVWPVAQRSYLAYGTIPPFDGTPPIAEKGVVVSERYQTEARRIKEEIRIAEAARIRDGGTPPLPVPATIRGGRGRGGGGEGGGGRQQKKQERKKRLRENQQARGSEGQQPAGSRTGGGGNRRQNDVLPQREPSNAEQEDYSEPNARARDDCSPGGYDQEDDPDDDHRDDSPPDDRLPFAFPFDMGSANERSGKRARYD